MLYGFLTVYITNVVWIGTDWELVKKPSGDYVNTFNQFFSSPWIPNKIPLKVWEGHFLVVNTG